MRIYTRTGDDGTTGLLGRGRVSKDSLRVEALGAIDECNAAIGVARTAISEENLGSLFEDVQSLLFSAGADLAYKGDTEGPERVQEEDVREIEAAIDLLEGQVPALRAFILPGGCLAAAYIHLARTVCRRAERNIVRLSHVEAINPQVLSAINRLSDLLFVVARVLSASSGTSETIWNKARWIKNEK